MAKSNKQRKRDQRSRQHRAAESRLRAERLSAAARRQRLLDEAYALGTAPARVAEILLEIGGPYPRLGVITTLRVATSGEHAKAVVAAVHEQAPESLWALCLAIDLALLTDQEAAAATLAGTALAADASLLHVHALAFRWAMAGEVLPAAELLWRFAAEDPYDEQIATDLALIVDGEEAGPVVDRFMDRSALYAARDAALAAARSSRWEDAVEDAVGEWLAAAGGGLHPEVEAWQTMAFEQAVLRVGDDRTDEGFFAVVAGECDPEVAAPLLDWVDTVHYGLWQVEEIRFGPGLWLTDIVTGTTRYVAMPPEQRDGLARWSVLLGPVACIRGVWMPLSGFVPLSPSDGERAALRVEDAFRALDDRPGHRQAALRPRSFVRTVLSPDPEAWEPEAAHFASVVIGVAMPAVLREHLEEPGVRLQTTDGESMVVTTLRLQLDQGVDELVEVHPDLEQVDDGFVLLGTPLPPEQVAAALASAGIDPTDLVDDGPPRVTRAHVARDGAQWTATVMSQERERALLEVLSPLSPRVLDRTAIEPDQDMVLPRRTLTPAPGPTWPDEPHPQLDGLTPREAVDDDELVLAVELLLRIAEHDSDLRGEPIDVFGLREELELLE